MSQIYNCFLLLMLAIGGDCWECFILLMVCIVSGINGNGKLNFLSSDMKLKCILKEILCQWHFSCDYLSEWIWTWADDEPFLRGWGQVSAKTIFSINFSYFLSIMQLTFQYAAHKCLKIFFTSKMCWNNHFHSVKINKEFPC